MDQLSLPIDRLRDEYDVVVVGSGYGGAATAHRIAASHLEKNGGAPVRVCLLERGAERHPGSYPRTFLQAMRLIRVSGRAWSFGPDHGMFDLHLNRDISVLVGSGLGGTSLINAGVMLPPDPARLKEGWPSALFDKGLDEGFERARKMIQPATYPAKWPQLNKRVALGKVACTSAAKDVEIAVSFTTKASSGGVQMQACTLCGDCVTGCNHSAKSTLITNYIPAAVANGAEVFCGVTVRWLEPAGPDPCDGWRLHLTLAQGGWRRFRRHTDVPLRARIVVLAAGTLGSTEILLRSRERTGGRLAVSERLGTRFSGNGDVIAFGYNNEVPVDGFGCGGREPDEYAPVGPTITGMIDERDQSTSARVVIEEGAIPAPAAILVRLFAPFAARISRFGSASRPRLDKLLRAWWREVESTVHSVRAGALRNTQTYLVLGDDSNGGRSTGTIEMRRDRLRIRWPGVGREHLFCAVNKRLRHATEQLGGSHVSNPFWSRLFGWNLLTVHPLGGCPMADDSTEGVVNHWGQVFRTDGGSDRKAVYDTLYVLDGSVIPTPIGLNPLGTISAIAERNSAQLLIEHASRLAQPPSVTRAKSDGKKPGLPRGPACPGLAFSERLRGQLTRCNHTGQPHGESFPIELLLHIRSPDLETMLSQHSHSAGITGLTWAPRIFGAEPLRVVRGGFNLFTTDTDHVDTRKMVYQFQLIGAGGERYTAKGTKVVHCGPGPRRPVWNRWSRLWHELTTLDLTIDRDLPRRVPFAVARVRIAWLDEVRSIASLRVPGAKTRWERWKWTMRFVRFYKDVLIGAVIWPFGPRRVPDAFTEKQQYRALFSHRGENGADAGGAETVVRGASLKPAKPPMEFEEYDVPTGDRVLIHLSRHCNPKTPSNPILLAPGWGNSTYCYTVASQYVRRNFVEFLVDQGADVWLMDYRGSELSPGSGSQYTLDDIARYDWPAAVAHVHRETTKKVRVIGHCVGSMTLLMALLRGWLDEKQVQCAVCSQSFIFVEMPRPNRVKAHLRMAEILQFLRFWPTLASDYERDASWRDRILDRLFRLYPTDERCYSPVCRRILFLFGEVFRHDHLDPATHTAIRDMFNRADLATFRHLTAAVRRRVVLDYQGRNVYVLPENVPNINVPVTLVQSTKNGLFLRKGGVKTFDWLRANSPHPELFRWCEFPSYGHLDPFIGRYTDDHDVAHQQKGVVPEPTYERFYHALMR